MLHKVLEFIRREHLIEEHDRIVAGISGGADSVCLLFVLLELSHIIPLEIIAVHVEHGIRGQEALEDADYVELLCRQNGVICERVSVDVPKLAAQQGISEEEAGRNARYGIFEQMRQKWQAQKIAVAHTINDSAETVIFNLLRGSGLKGLTGIPVKRDAIIRPLLCVDRQEIEQYLERREISYRTDSTNLSDDYTRNMIRNRILPLMTEHCNAKAIEHIVRMSQTVKQAEDFIREQAESMYNCMVKETGGVLELSVQSFKQQGRIMQEYVCRMAVENSVGGLKDIGAVHVEKILGLLDAEVGRQISLVKGVKAVRTYDSILLGREKAMRSEEAEAVCVDIDVPLWPEAEKIYHVGSKSVRILLKNWKNTENIIEKEYTKWFDYDKIKGNLQIRNRQTGDKIVLFADGGQKKLKDYMIDMKIPRKERDSILLLADGHQIMWIVGYRMSAAYQITAETKKVLEIQILEEET